MKLRYFVIAFLFILLAACGNKMIQEQGKSLCMLSLALIIKESSEKVIYACL
jgi:hypothetical protein